MALHPSNTSHTRRSLRDASGLTTGPVGAGRAAAAPLPGSDASIANMVSRNRKKGKRSIAKRLQDAVGGKVNTGIRRFVLGRSDVTGEF